MSLVYTKDTEDVRLAPTVDSAAGKVMATAPSEDDGSTAAADDDDDDASAVAETGEEPATSLSYPVSFGDGVAEEGAVDANLTGIDSDGILYQVLSQVQTAYKRPPVGGRSDKPVSEFLQSLQIFDDADDAAFFFLSRRSSSLDIDRLESPHAPPAGSIIIMPLRSSTDGAPVDQLRRQRVPQVRARCRSASIPPFLRPIEEEATMSSLSPEDRTSLQINFRQKEWATGREGDDEEEGEVRDETRGRNNRWRSLDSVFETCKDLNEYAAEERMLEDQPPSDRSSAAESKSKHLLSARKHSSFEGSQQERDNASFSSIERDSIHAIETSLLSEGEVQTCRSSIPQNRRNQETDFPTLDSVSPRAVYNKLDQEDCVTLDTSKSCPSNAHSSTMPAPPMDRGQHNATLPCIDRLCNSCGIFYVVLTSCSVFLACLTSASPVCLVLFVAMASLASFHICS